MKNASVNSIKDSRLYKDIFQICVSKLTAIFTMSENKFWRDANIDLIWQDLHTYIQVRFMGRCQRSFVEFQSPNFSQFHIGLALLNIKTNLYIACKYKV